MSKKRQPFVLRWWDDDKDAEVSLGVPTYDETLIQQSKLRKRGINARIEIR